MTKIEIVLIAAVADNMVIGRGDDLPWRIPADLKHFKATTLDHVMVMGSTTWKSFGGRALPKRHHVVVTRSPDSIQIHEEDRGSVTVMPSIPLALWKAETIAEKQNQNTVFVIGGADIYRQTIGLADRMILTRVRGNHDGDKFFPIEGFNPSRVIPRQNPETAGHIFESNGYEYSIWDYFRDDAGKDA